MCVTQSPEWVCASWVHTSLQHGLAGKGEDKRPLIFKGNNITCIGVVWALVNLPLLLGEYLLEE